MMTRDEAARAFAEKTGLTLEGRGGMGFGTKWCFARRGSIKVTEFFDIPAPDAPLHEHLAFVGRVAEAIRPVAAEFSIVFVNGGCLVQFFRSLADCVPGSASGGDGIDLCHAALLAALAALEAR